jgi:acyl-CoA reductase-like NAD-dependent aldehyde dehydrogenase
MIGNTVVLKQSPQTPLCAERFNDAAKEAGFPDGVFQVILALNKPISTKLIYDIYILVFAYDT